MNSDSYEDWNMVNGGSRLRTIAELEQDPEFRAGVVREYKRASMSIHLSNYLGLHKWTKRKLAQRIGITRKKLDDLLMAEADLKPHLVTRIETVVGPDPRSEPPARWTA